MQGADVIVSVIYRLAVLGEESYTSLVDVSMPL